VKKAKTEKTGKDRKKPAEKHPLDVLVDQIRAATGISLADARVAVTIMYADSISSEVRKLTGIDAPLETMRPFTADALVKLMNAVQSGRVRMNSKGEFNAADVMKEFKAEAKH
jgi:hypothetical protein